MHLSSPQLELQRQQLLADRQQFQKDQLKVNELRALQSPTMGPTTPLQFPPSRPPHRSPTLITPAQPMATMAIIQAEAEGSKVKVAESDVPMDQSDSVAGSTATAEPTVPIATATHKEEPVTPATTGTESGSVPSESVATATLTSPDDGAGETSEGVKKGGCEGETERGDGVEREEANELPKSNAESASPVAETTPTEVQAPPTDSGIPADISTETSPTVETTPTSSNAVLEAITSLDEVLPVENEATPTTDDAPPTSTDLEALCDATPTLDKAPPPAMEPTPKEVTGSAEAETLAEESHQEEEQKMEVREGGERKGDVEGEGEGEGGDTVGVGESAVQPEEGQTSAEGVTGDPVKGDAVVEGDRERGEGEGEGSGGEGSEGEGVGLEKEQQEEGGRESEEVAEPEVAATQPHKEESAETEVAAGVIGDAEDKSKYHCVCVCACMCVCVCVRGRRE